MGSASSHQYIVVGKPSSVGCILPASDYSVKATVRSSSSRHSRKAVSETSDDKSGHRGLRPEDALLHDTNNAGRYFRKREDSAQFKPRVMASRLGVPPVSVRRVASAEMVTDSGTPTRAGLEEDVGKRSTMFPFQHGAGDDSKIECY